MVSHQWHTTQPVFHHNLWFLTENGPPAFVIVAMMYPIVALRVGVHALLSAKLLRLLTGELLVTSCAVHGAIYTVLSSVTRCQWIYTCMNRSKMRQQYMLADEPCNDCCLHCCCESCALCQEYRELKNRGFLYVSL